MKLIIFLAAAVVGWADEYIADSARGAKLFESLSCIQCHSVSGRGARIAPDLGRIVDRNFTPASLAATMWNHAPTMWSAMREREIRPGDLDAHAARDLFAYFYSNRFFDKPGDAGRGKRAFTERGCTKCHGLTEVVRPMIKPVSQWEALDNPIALSQAMWNHRQYMLEQTGVNRIQWPELTAEDLTDMLVYFRHLPSPPSKKPVFVIGEDHNGVAVFNSKGCPTCHTPGSGLSSRIRGETLTAIAAEMWNHAPRMAAAGAKPVEFAPGEMDEMLNYLWARQFFQDYGNPAAGRRAFESKRCAVCHRDASSGAPPIEGRSITASDMVAALWHHGPRMLDQMKSKNIAWPRFEGQQMSDLLAFLNSGAKGKP
jgi:cytochrome c2